LLILRSSDVLVRLDPLRGAEILDLVDLRSGRQLLGRLPYGTDAERAAAPDEDSWLAGYRGGWQVAVPNAGSGATVGGVTHSFHGNASYEPWEVHEDGADRALLRWSGKGLRVTREVRVAGPAVHVAMTIEAERERTPYIVLEHLSFGHEVIDPAATVELPSARAVESSDDGPLFAPDDAPRWPEARMLDGSIARVDRMALAEQAARFIAVHDLPEGVAVIRPEREGVIGLRLAWDVEALGHAWIWHETRASGRAFRGLTEILGIEPASVPHSLGLADAVANGQASWVEPGKPAGYRLALELLPPA
jgi:hypothetical protein